MKRVKKYAVKAMQGNLSHLSSVCSIASNKRQNSWTEQVQTLCSNTHDRREGLKNA